ncbi:MAG: desulfoferrodoxin [Treponema sp.]|nr:desulfoferrodoxin [Treponema sp.]
MTKQFEIYKCGECGNVMEVIVAGGGEPVCCGKPMKRLTENTTDAAREKHVPVIEETDEGYMVRVGLIAHPMEERHYIQWIELLADGVSYRKFLKPGDKSEAFFPLKASRIVARAYCNLHGLWKV